MCQSDLKCYDVIYNTMKSDENVDKLSRIQIQSDII